MRNPVFVAIDPGSTTGIVLVVMGEGGSPHERIHSGKREVLELDTTDGNVHELADIVQEFFEEELGHEWVNGTVVIEDFILRTADKRRKTMDPIRVTHALRSVLEERGWYGKWVKQQPSSAKSVVTDARLRRWNLWIVGKVHGRDAMRHALLYARSL